MIIHKATYIISSPDTASCPKPDRPEYAFIGRSNVGKSSLINMITGTKNLAKTSSTPGKTQLIPYVSLVPCGFARLWICQGIGIPTQKMGEDD
jgi:GTP-binding protein